MSTNTPQTAAALGRSRSKQVDPIKPTLNEPGTKRLKFKPDELLTGAKAKAWCILMHAEASLSDEMLSSFCFNVNLRHYTSAPLTPRRTPPRSGNRNRW